MIFNFFSKTPFSSSPVTTVKTAALAMIETTINNALAYDPATQNAMKVLAGKVIAIQCTLPSLTFYVVHGEHDISLMSTFEGELDTTLKGTSLALAALAIDGQDRVTFFDSGVEVRGDQDLLRRIKKILKSLDIDWEAALSQLVGDVPAHLIGESLRATSRWQRDSINRARTAAVEFSQEEIRLTPSKNEVNQFNQEVKHLACDTDRLSARMNKLNVMLNKKNNGDD